MSDESTDALRTPLGREKLLDAHDDRLDYVEKRVTDIERKEEARDKRWDLVFKSMVSIGVGIIIAVVSTLIATGVHL